MNRGSSFREEFAEGAQFFLDTVNNISRALSNGSSGMADFAVLNEAITDQDPAVGPGRSVQESGFIARVAMSPDNRHLRLV